MTCTAITRTSVRRNWEGEDVTEKAWARIRLGVCTPGRRGR